MKRIIIATLAVFALGGTAFAGNNFGDQSKENTTIIGDKTHVAKDNGDVKEDKLFVHGDKSVENTNDPKHKLTAEEAAKEPVEGITPDGDGSPQE